MGEKYIPDKKSVYVQYLVANNVYGWAMSKPLPIRDFKWMSKDELQHWRQFSDQEGIGCILEVNLKYPKERHELHNDIHLHQKDLL